jgi:probable O-glycosylation ligase (exosortase A-associated)
MNDLRTAAPPAGARSIPGTGEGRLLFSGIILFFLFEYIRPSIYLPALDVLHLNAAIPVLLALATLVSSRGFPRSTMVKNFNVKLMCFYTCLFVLSVFAARVRYTALLTFKDVAGYFIAFYFILKNLDQPRKIRTIFSVIVWIHVFVILVNIGKLTDFDTRHYLDAGYFMGDGNDFAFSLNIAWPLCLYFIKDSKSVLWKTIYAAVLLLMLAAIIATQSRGASLALAAVTFYLWTQGKRKLLGIIVIVIGVVILLSYGSQEYWDRMVTIRTYETEGSAVHRIMAWKSAIRMALDYPLTGIGAGGFHSAFGILYRPPGVGRTDLKWLNAHSIYFKLLGELGFPGLIVLLAFLWKNLSFNQKIRKKLMKYADGKKAGVEETSSIQAMLLTINASIIGFSVAGAFLSGIYYPHLYVIMALSAAVQMNAPAFAVDRDPFPGKDPAVTADG